MYKASTQRTSQPTALLALISLGALVAGGCEGIDTGEETEVTSITEELTIGGARVGGGGPGGADFNGATFLTFTGTDRRINIMRSQPDGGFAKQTLEEKTHGGSSLAVYNNELYLVWIGTNWSFNSLKSSDGITWRDKKSFGAREAFHFHADPALVVYGGALNAFISHGPDDLDYEEAWGPQGWMEHRVLFTGGEWDRFPGFDAESFLSPSATVMGDELFVAWMDRHGDSFRVRKFTPGKDWSEQSVISGTMEGQLITAQSSPPALLWFYRIAGGNIGPNQIELLRSTNGVDFDFMTRFNHTTGARPFALSATGNRIRFAHVGTDGGRSLNFNDLSF